MLNFTTTTIINDKNNIVHSNGSTIYKAGTTSLGADNSGDGKFIRVNFGPKLFNDGTIHKAVLVGKQPYTPAVFASAEVTPITNANAIYRIAMYIRLRNNNNPYFYNNWTFKGRPLYIEFSTTANDTASDIVDSIIINAKKYMLAQYGQNLVNFSKNSSTNHLVITATDQWEIFMDQDSNDGVKLEKLVVVDSAGQPVSASTTLPTHEEFQPVANQSTYVTVNNGNEAFGDFAHIVKDLRLPTAANRRWQGIAEGDVFGGEPNDDKPNPSGQYTQYTIQYTSERGVLQQTAVGGLGVSRTVHVFYVEGDATAAFEAALLGSEIVKTQDEIQGYKQTTHTFQTGDSVEGYYTKDSTTGEYSPASGTYDSTETYYEKVITGGLV